MSSKLNGLVYSPYGPLTLSGSVNAAMMLATILCKIIDLLQNGFATHLGVTALYSMREVLAASS